MKQYVSHSGVTEGSALPLQVHQSRTQACVQVPNEELHTYLNTVQTIFNEDLLKRKRSVRV